jgi:hypothetical protein
VINMKNADDPILRPFISDPLPPRLTKRDHFAGMAMQALVTNELSESHHDTWPECCELAVEIADSLLAALDK